MRHVHYMHVAALRTPVGVACPVLCSCPVCPRAVRARGRLAGASTVAAGSRVLTPSSTSSCTTTSNQTFGLRRRALRVGAKRKTCWHLFSWHLRWHPGARCRARCHMTRARPQHPQRPFFSLRARPDSHPTPPPAPRPARARPRLRARPARFANPLLSYNSTGFVRAQNTATLTTRDLQEADLDGTTYGPF